MTDTNQSSTERYNPAPRASSNRDTDMEGYRRPDDAIYREVCEIMLGSGKLDASKIDVRVADGKVTLTGTVGNELDKQMATELAESVPDVQEVNNQLQIP